MMGNAAYSNEATLAEGASDIGATVSAGIEMLDILPLGFDCHVTLIERREDEDITIRRLFLFWN